MVIIASGLLVSQRKRRGADDHEGTGAGKAGRAQLLRDVPDGGAPLDLGGRAPDHVWRVHVGPRRADVPPVRGERGVQQQSEEATSRLSRVDGLRAKEPPAIGRGLLR